MWGQEEQQHNIEWEVGEDGEVGGLGKKVSQRGMPGGAGGLEGLFQPHSGGFPAVPGRLERKLPCVGFVGIKKKDHFSIFGSVLQA